MKKIYAAIHLMFFIILANAISLGQSSTKNHLVLLANPLEIPVSSLEVCDNKVGNVLATLASQYKVPIGVEVQLEKYDVEPQNAACLTVKNGTIRSVLKAITTLFPNYEWKETNGVINITYKNGLEEKNPLLDAVINHFEVNQASIDDIKSIILQKSEVQANLNNSGFEVHEPALLPQLNYDTSSKFSFAMDNKSVREILNYIIGNTRNKYWSAVRWGEYKDKKYLWIIIW